MANSTDMSNPWIAVFSAACFCFAPRYLDILWDMPTLIPWFKEIKMKNKGKENVKAAMDSAPSLPTKAVSTILYKVWKVIAMIMGEASLNKAFLGFFMNVSTLLSMKSEELAGL